MATSPRRLRAYVSGALTGIEGDQHLGPYELAARVLRRHGFEAYLPHLATDPIRHPDVSPVAVYETDRARVASADVIVTFLSRPSLGVGMELEIAAEALVPVLTVVRKGDPISRMALGGPARHFGPIRYENVEELEAALERLLPGIIAELTVRASRALPEIGTTIEVLRKSRGMDRRTLADRAGTTEDWIRMLELAEPIVSNPSLALLASVASALEISAAELLGARGASETELLRSLRAFAIEQRISFDEYQQLERAAARGLRADRGLSTAEWSQIREAQARARAGVEQPELLGPSS